MTHVKPKKHLGQHFLTDLNIARKIVACLQPTPDAQVVEIGPGTGVLSRLLVELPVRLTLIEVDPESIAVLERDLGSRGVQVIRQSFLDWQPASLLALPGWFIGNLPYNISSPIFFHLLENRSHLARGVFMIQKEVAERICSGPGTKQYGILSVLMQAYFKVKYEFTVSEKVFFPRPKVLSAVISIEPLAAQAQEPDFHKLKTVVKAAFNQRRKQLRNALSSLHFTDMSGVEPFLKLRAEQLSVDDFIRLSSLLTSVPATN